MQAMNSNYEPRFYRGIMGADRFKSFAVTFKETDLWIGVDPKHYCTGMKNYTQDLLKGLRASLEGYIRREPDFFYSLTPYKVSKRAPNIVTTMARAASKAKVGPMAAVAGVFSQWIGQSLERAYGLREIIVENGGDIYINTRKSATFSVYAGKCGLPDQIMFEVPSYLFPVGVCTSSGTLGHSFSFGIADAVTVICKDVGLADAYATYFCNAVQPGKDIMDVLELSSQYEDVIAIVIISEGKFGIRGDVRILPR